MPIYVVPDLGTDDAFTAAPVPPAQGGVNPPPEVVTLLRRVKDAMERIQIEIPAGPGRTTFAKTLLRKVRPGLEDGTEMDLATAALEEFRGQTLAVRYYSVDFDETGELGAAPAPWAPQPMPDDVAVFLSKIETVIDKIKLLLPDSTKKTAYLDTVLSHAKYGLEQGAIAAAGVALVDFKNYFVLGEGPEIRKNYIMDTLRTARDALGLAVGAGLLINFLYFQPQPYFPSVNLVHEVHKFVPTAEALAFGMVLGITFFAFVRNLDLTFDSLGRFDSASLNPRLRFLLVAIVIIIACIFLRAGVAKIELAGIKLEEFQQHRINALVLGILCGYSDVTITGILTKTLGIGQTR